MPWQQFICQNPFSVTQQATSGFRGVPHHACHGPACYSAIAIYTDTPKNGTHQQAELHHAKVHLLCSFILASSIGLDVKFPKHLIVTNYWLQQHLAKMQVHMGKSKLGIHTTFGLN